MEQIKRIVLRSIKLQNWSSINSFVTFSENRTRIMGANKIGKTSIICAWRWLLTSRVDAVHPANYKLFDKRKPLTPQTPEAVVEAVVDINGIEYTLTRKAKAAFVKGEKATSDKYTTLIDNIEYTATQFNEWIEANIAPVAMLPFCIDGIFFATLCEEDKKKGRKVLEGIVGEITKGDFKGDYSIIADMLAKLPIEKIVEKTKAEIAQLNERVTKIPVEIEVKEGIIAKWNNDTPSNDEVNNAKARIAELDDKINNAVDKDAEKQREELFAKINSKELSLQQSRNAHEAEYCALVGGFKAQIKGVQEYNKNIEYENELLREDRARKERMLRNLINQVDGLQREREVLIKKRDEIKARVFAEHKCSYCGQDLPIEMLQDLKAKFLEQKSKELDAVVTQGKAVATNIADCEEQIKLLEEGLSMPLLLHTLQSDAEFVEKLKNAEDNFVRFEDTDVYKTTMQEIAELKQEVMNIKVADVEGLVIEKQSVMRELEDLLKRANSKDKCNELQDEIDVLYQEQKDVACKVVARQGVLDKCKEWIEERASIISNRINDRLEGCSIQMYSVQKNGEQTPDCVILDKNGVEYGKTNTAECLMMNIALQRLFMSHYGIELPIFVDECSRFSPSNIPVIKEQNILIFATDDKTLKIEHE